MVQEYSKFVWAPPAEVAFFEAALSLQPVGAKMRYEAIKIRSKFSEITGLKVLNSTLTEYYKSLINEDAVAERSNDWNREDPFSFEAGSETEDEGDNELIPEKPNTSRTVKDYTRTKTPVRSKKKEATPVPVKVAVKAESGSDSEDEVPLKPATGSRTRNTSTSSTASGAKKIGPVSAKKEAPKRGSKRGAPPDKESSPASTRKADEEVSRTLREPPVGRRSLRSRAEDDASNKSSSPAATPPPTKRTRRI